MKDLVDTHRESISTAAAARDKAIIDATATFQAAVSVYRDATQQATDDYSAAVTASEAALDLQMEQRTRDFFGEVPVNGPVIRITAPQPAMPQASEGPGLKVAGYANGGAAGAQA